MPTYLVAGNKPQRGFTLTELMIVLALMALAATAVVLTLPGDSDRLRGEADRLAARIAAVRNLAIIENRPAAVWISPSGHGVEQLDRGGWVAANGRALAPHGWTVPVAVAGEGGADQVRIAFDMAGLVERPARITLRAGDAEAVLRVAANGNVTIGGAP